VVTGAASQVVAEVAVGVSMLAKEMARSLPLARLPSAIALLDQRAGFGQDWAPDRTLWNSPRKESSVRSLLLIS